jgi:hypothetical protein
VKPSGLHGPPQTPFAHGLVQQASGLAHAAPSGWHIVDEHTPALHAPEQHCAPVWQTNPAGWQLPPHALSWQSRLQHSASSKQIAPCGLHSVD